MNFNKPARLCLREENGFGYAGLSGDFCVVGFAGQMRGKPDRSSMAAVSTLLPAKVTSHSYGI
jgi:hypothetical protein